MSDSNPTASEENSTGKFEVRVTDDIRLDRDSMVEHVEYGPMHVDRVTYSPTTKRVELKSELGPEGLTLTADELRERWGETLHTDPAELYNGSQRVTFEGITTSDGDVSADLSVAGTSDYVELVAMHVKDQAVRAMQAVDEERPPAECDGIGVEIDWERAFAEEGEDE
jgi:hypothetical protein